MNTTTTIERAAIESSGSDAAEICTNNADNTSVKGDKESNPIARILLLLWNAVMIVSTTILSFFVFVLKDDSVLPFVVLGVVGICIPLTINMIREKIRYMELQKERDEIIQKAQEERIRQARLKEWERIQREKLLAGQDEKMLTEYERLEQELANSFKNIDVKSFKQN